MGSSLVVNKSGPDVGAALRWVKMQMRVIIVSAGDILGRYMSLSPNDLD